MDIFLDCKKSSKNLIMITLKTLPEATPQEVFDQVKNHLLAQNKQCIGTITCRYRNEEGLKCAAGCLISDEEYLPEMEIGLWSKLIERDLVPPNHQDLILALQHIHDSYSPMRWKEQLDKLEKDLHLYV